MTRRRSKAPAKRSAREPRSAFVKALYKNTGELFDTGGKALIGFLGLGKIVEASVSGEPLTITIAAGLVGIAGLAAAALGVYLKSEGER